MKGTLNGIPSVSKKYDIQVTSWKFFNSIISIANNFCVVQNRFGILFGFLEILIPVQSDFPKRLFC